LCYTIFAVSEFAAWYQKHVRNVFTGHCEPVSTGFPYQTPNSFGGGMRRPVRRHHPAAASEGVAVTPTTDREYLVQLREMLTASFDAGELRTLCFDLGIDYDDLPGEGKGNKVRELITYLERRDRIPELVRICEQQRPNVAWRDVPGAPQDIPAALPAVPAEPYRLDYEHGLSQLRESLGVSAPALLSTFHTLEARLLENLQNERLYGSTETVRAERAQVVHALNDLAGQTRLGRSFNDLCQAQVGRQPADALAGSTSGPQLAGKQGERERASLRSQLENARENLRLIRERKSQYVMETAIPLDLIKQERRLEEQIAGLEERLAQFG
jgi:hypothetical protein